MPKKVKRIELDRNSHGIVFEKYTFMIDGYISDYSEDPNAEKSYKDLITRKGDVDDEGLIWIYQNNREDGRKLSPVPWFTYNKDIGKYVTQVIRVSDGKELLKDGSCRPCDNLDDAIDVAGEIM